MRDEELLRATQAAAYLGCIPENVYRLAQAGKLGRRFAGVWVFSREELDAFAVAPRDRRGRPPKKANGLLAEKRNRALAIK